MPALERWKIFDNLRRSLTPGAILAMLIAGCAISPNALVCALLVLILLLASVFFPLAQRLTHRWMADPIVWREPALNTARSLLFAAALPQQAWISLNAIGRVAYRRIVSHRHLLEWATSSGRPASPRKGPTRGNLLRMAWPPFLAAAAVVLVGFPHSHERRLIWPFGALWVAAPFLLVWIDRTVDTAPSLTLSAADREGLRRTARQTWRYFHDFVNPKTNDLPPDNFQEALRVELAERTSPTNIGLYLDSALAAHDFGYISFDELVRRVTATMTTLGKLLRSFEGIS